MLSVPIAAADRKASGLKPLPQKTSLLSQNLTIPDSRFPIPDSRFPIPDSRFPNNQPANSTHAGA
ncbi:hypothetical protein LG3211_5102 [Lysobacter gummosus]|nr:hypothetical protein LG3211_5102 [Lysobacter gummosus]